MKKLKISAACSYRKMVACLVSLSLSEAALAGCDIFNPVSGQTVTCSVAAPNPSAMGATAVVGSDNVTVNIDTGTILNLNDQNGVLVYSDSAVFQRGTLNITNDSFDGISARLAGNSLHNLGTITTQGFQSEGIYLSGTASQAINESGGQIITSGENSSGIISFGSSPATVGNNTLLNAGSISTSGTLSSGIYAQGSGNQLTNTGSITTSGTNASGLQANGSDNSISNSGTVVTQGLGANAINNDGGATLGSVTNSGSLSTRGDFANGVYFGGSADFTNTATGTITSTSARGVLATGGGTLTNNGMINAGRDGIDSPAGAVTIINTGSITSGNERAVYVESNDNSTLINSGDLTGNGVAVQFSGGNDVFIWQNSGTLSGSADMGAGDDSVTLRRLTDVNLAAMPLLQGGAGQDQLTLENSQLSDPSRFIDWESVLLQSASQLSMTRPLVLGDATTQTGTLSIDSTSVLLAGGQSAADIAGFGGANDVTVTNAGTLDLTDSAGSTHDRLTIHGNYVGDNGVLKLQTVLNGDDSASDRLVISGGQASGSTQIQVTNVGGTGVATAGSGIMLVEATNGATTTASAFTLAGGSVSAGAYDYLLFRGSSDDAQSWYLRNSLIVVTPPVPPPR